MKIELNQSNWELVYKFLKETSQEDTEEMCNKYGMENAEEIDYSLFSLYEELRVEFKRLETEQGNKWDGGKE